MFLDYLFLSYRAYRHTDRQTDTKTHTQTVTQAAADEFSIAAVDKPQLYKVSFIPDETGIKAKNHFFESVFKISYVLIIRHKKEMNYEQSVTLSL